METVSKPTTAFALTEPSSPSPTVKREICVPSPRDVVAGKPVKTALHQAVRDGRIHQARLLLASMPNIDIQDVNGWTPLMLTCALNKERASMKLIRMFLKRGASINFRDKMGRTPLMIACLMDQTAIIKRLLAEDGLELTIQDNDGSTALMHAAMKTDPAALNLILMKMMLFRLDVDARNYMGYTALLLACKQGNYHSGLSLVRMGNACPYLRDSEFKYCAKDWLLRFRRQQTQVIAERGRFPHLATCRQLSAAPLPAQRNIDFILSKTYISSQLNNGQLTLQRSTPNIHLSCQQENQPENIPQWEQEDKDHVYGELLKEITKAEQDYDAARDRLIEFRSGQYGKSSHRMPKRREVTTASLRAVSSPSDGRTGKKRGLTLQYILNLYALECNDKKDNINVSSISLCI